jgi:hypothetical protein
MSGNLDMHLLALEGQHTRIKDLEPTLMEPQRATEHQQVLYVQASAPSFPTTLVVTADMDRTKGTLGKVVSVSSTNTLPRYWLGNSQE